MICTNEDTKLINEIMRDFTNITKIAAIFVNNRGKVLSQEYNFSPFCKVVRRNPAYAKRCNQCDLYGGLDATKELSSCPYRCHMGLIDFSVPIMKDGAILGFIMAGQTKTEDTTIKLFCLPKPIGMMTLNFVHYIRHYQFLQQNKSTVLQRFYGFW